MKNLEYRLIGIILVSSILLCSVGCELQIGEDGVETTINTGGSIDCSTSLDLESSALNDDICGAESDTPAQDERYGFYGGNISAGGLIASDGEGNIYFRSEADKWALCAVKSDGTNRRKLCDDWPSLINVLDGWVYFSNASDDFSIYRIRTDGTDKEKLIDGYCRNLHVSSEGMFYDKRNESNIAQVYCANLDGTGEKLIIPDMRVAAYYDGILYCNTTHELIAYDLTDGSIQSICNMYTANVFADSTGVYYWAVDENEFHHVNMDTLQTTILYNNPGGNFYNYVDGKIYVTKSVGGQCIVDMVDIDKNTIETIATFSNSLFDFDGNGLDINILDYYTGKVMPDQSLLDPDGVYNVFTENISYIYVAEGRLIGRGTLPYYKSIGGKLDCLIEISDSCYEPWSGDIMK